MSEKLSPDPEEVYSNPAALGEQPQGVPREAVFTTDVALTSQQALFDQLTDGEVGKFARARQEAGFATAAFIKNSRKVGVFIAENPEAIIAGATALTVVAGVALYPKEITRGAPKSYLKSQEE